MHEQEWILINGVPERPAQGLVSSADPLLERGPEGAAHAPDTGWSVRRGLLEVCPVFRGRDPPRGPVVFADLSPDQQGISLVM